MSDAAGAGKSLRASAPEFTFQGVPGNVQQSSDSIASPSRIPRHSRQTASPNKGKHSPKTHSYSQEDSASESQGEKQIYASRGISRTAQRKAKLEDKNERYYITRDIFDKSFSAESSKRKVEEVFDVSKEPNVPNIVNKYHSLKLIEEHVGSNAACLNYRSISATDGKLYILRRIVGNVPYDAHHVVKTVEKWKQIRHPGVVPLCEAFTTFAFSQGAANELIFVYPFYHDAQVFGKVFLSTEGNLTCIPLDEEVVWTLFIQLVSSLDALHAENMIAGDSLSITGSFHRNIDSERFEHFVGILVVGKNRIKLSKCGIGDALSAESVGGYSAYNTVSYSDTERKKMEDIWRLLSIMILIILRSETSIVQHGMLKTDVNEAFRALKSLGIYSSHLLQVLELLVESYNNNRALNIVDISSMISSQLLYDYDHVWFHAENLENELSRRLNSTRLFQLLSLFGFILSLDDPRLTSQWSETSDKYILRLFLEYMFYYQIDEEGNPSLNMSHVVECLNRVDIGSEEPILLASKDSKSLLVVSYADIRYSIMKVLSQVPIYNRPVH
eukprot:jgi/Galph1/832/GphlegSOOS_G5567.1